jgi:hypothetical protein
MLGLASLLMIPMAWGLREPGFGGAAPPTTTIHHPGLREAFNTPASSC